MGFVLFIFAIVALIWGGLALKHVKRQSFQPIPVGAAVLLVVASVFGPEFFSVGGPITLDRLLLVAIIGVFVAMIFLGFEQLRPLNRTDFLVYGMMALLGFSTFTHDWQLAEKLPMTRLLFFNLLPVSVYFVIRNCNMGTKELKMMALIFSGLGIYLALTGVAEVKGITAVVFPRYISNAEFQEFFGRARGPFLNPVSNGIFMTTCFAALLCWWFEDRRLRILCVFAAPIFLMGIYSTLTRSVWLSLILSGGIIACLMIPKHLRSTFIAGGVVVGIVGLLVFGGSLSSFKRDKFVTEAEMQQSAELRPLFAIVALKMFKDRPIMGHGFGQYKQAKWPYLADTTGKHQLSLTKTYYQHNLFLAFVTETGLIGLSVLLLLMINAATMSLAIWRNQQRDWFARCFGLIGLVALTCHATNGMFHDVSIAPMNNMLFFFMIGLTTNLFTSVHATMKSTTAQHNSVPQRQPTHPSQELYGRDSFPAT